MASYLLLLKAIGDKTPEGHPDKTLIPQAMKAIGDVLSKMNEASGVTINKIKLMQLHQQINPENFVSDFFSALVLSPQNSFFWLTDYL
jgi:hypothetical protein